MTCVGRAGNEWKPGVAREPTNADTPGFGMMAW